MPRYVAFLRAVNVGGRIVKMDELRGHFERAGFEDVETFIASGNVIFSTRATSTPALETKIESQLRKALGYDVPTMIRTTAEVALAAAHEPHPAKDLAGAGANVIAFLRTAPDAAGKKRLVELATPADRFVLHGREVHWLSTLRQSESKLTIGRFERAVGCHATMRAKSSVQKLAAKHCQREHGAPRRL